MARTCQYAWVMPAHCTRTRACSQWRQSCRCLGCSSCSRHQGRCAGWELGLPSTLCCQHCHTHTPVPALLCVLCACVPLACSVVCCQELATSAQRAAAAVHSRLLLQCTAITLLPASQATISREYLSCGASMHAQSECATPTQVLADWLSMLQPGGIAAVCFWPGSVEASGPWHSYGEALEEELGRASPHTGGGRGQPGSLAVVWLASMAAVCIAWPRHWLACRCVLRHRPSRLHSRTVRCLN